MYQKPMTKFILFSDGERTKQVLGFFSAFLRPNAIYTVSVASFTSVTILLQKSTTVYPVLFHGIYRGRNFEYRPSLIVRHNCFRFGGRHLAFPVSSIARRRRMFIDESVELCDTENLGIAVGTACLSVVEREI
jgi:hypothetical protein